MRWAIWSTLTTGVTPQNRTHNSQNQILSVSGAPAAPEYDNNGNLTKDETGKTYKYDAWNRLVQVVSGGTTLNYEYDALGRRIEEAIVSGTTTHLYYSDWQVLEERENTSTNAKAQYVWSEVYVDALVLRDRDATGDPLLEERLYVQQDANFNVTAVVDQSGNVVERYIYDPYGTVTVLDLNWNTLGGSGKAWRYLHQGGRFDITSGLYHFRNREFSPTLGRWLQRDPIEYAAGDLNLYRYVHNGPTSALDPSGHSAVSFGWGITQGIWAGGWGFIQGIGDLLKGIATDPVGTVTNIVNGVLGLIRTIATDGLAGAARELFPELHELLTQWCKLSDYRKGYLIGKVLGEYLTGLVTGGIAGRLLSRLRELRPRAPRPTTTRPPSTTVRPCPSFTNCFPAGTPVGTAEGLRPIETIQAVDRVWAFDHKTGSWRLCHVIETYTRELDGDLISVTVSGEVIEITYHHPFWVISGEDLDSRPRPDHIFDSPADSTVPGRWVDAGDLRVGDVLLLRDGRWAPVTEIAIRKAHLQVYNFHVEELQCYAVGANQALVHNCSGGGTGRPPRNPVHADLLEQQGMREIGPPSGRGMQNPAVRDAVDQGNLAHARLQERLQERGWRVDRADTAVRDPLTGRTVYPDAISPRGHPVEIKPRSETGRSRGAAQLEVYERATGRTGRVIYY